MKVHEEINANGSGRACPLHVEDCPKRGKSVYYIMFVDGEERWRLVQACLKVCLHLRFLPEIPQMVCAHVAILMP